MTGDAEASRADVVVVGAGPAGMATAVTCAEAGLDVLVLDEQRAVGGQIWRGVEAAAAPRGHVLGADYVEGLRLAGAFARAGTRYVRDAKVWQIEHDGAVTWSVAGRAQRVTAAMVVLATGALERPMPIPGWTLPGVLTAGAGQILLKEAGLVFERAVLAGTGPLLYLLAQQMIRAGRPPVALVETQGRTDLARAMLHLPRALTLPHYLLKGAAMLKDIRRAKVPRFQGAAALRIVGTSKAQGLAFNIGGHDREIACDMVLLHQGVVPDTQATRSLQLKHRWDDRQRCFVPVTNAWGCSSADCFYVVGDAAGIAGAKAAVHAGHLAALDIACRLRAVDESSRHGRAVGDRLALQRERAVRPFLEKAFPPAPATLAPADDVLVCRCEEVTAGEVRRWTRLGCLGPNQTKAYGRAGMGPCQGRYCALTVSELLAAEHGRSPGEIGTHRVRAPLKPVTLGELASLAKPPSG